MQRAKGNRFGGLRDIALKGTQPDRFSRASLCDLPRLPFAKNQSPAVSRKAAAQNWVVFVVPGGMGSRGKFPVISRKLWQFSKRGFSDVFCPSPLAPRTWELPEKGICHFQVSKIQFWSSRKFYGAIDCLSWEMLFFNVNLRYFFKQWERHLNVFISDLNSKISPVKIPVFLQFNSVKTWFTGTFRSAYYRCLGIWFSSYTVPG